MSKRGGKRPGSGAKLKYNEQTVVVSARVPKSKAAEIKAIILNALNKFK